MIVYLKYQLESLAAAVACFVNLHKGYEGSSHIGHTAQVERISSAQRSHCASVKQKRFEMFLEGDLGSDIPFSDRLQGSHVGFLLAVPNSKSTLALRSLSLLRY